MPEPIVAYWEALPVWITIGLAVLAALLLGIAVRWFWWLSDRASANSAIEPPPTKPSTLGAWIKSLSERIVRWRDKSDIVKIIELAGKFGLVIAAATYLVEIPAQRQAREDALKAKRYQAWAPINSAQGSAADGGRREALQDLSEDGVLLAGAYLACLNARADSRALG